MQIIRAFIMYIIFWQLMRQYVLRDLRESISRICFRNLIRKTARMEQFRIKGTGVTLNLAKNPAGFNQNISAVMQDQITEGHHNCDQ